MFSLFRPASLFFSLKTKKPLNYLFYLGWIFSLSLIYGLFLAPSFFSALETVLFFTFEALFLALISFFLEKKASKWLYKSTLGLIAFLFLFHLVSLFLKVLLDADWSFLYSLFSQDKSANFWVKIRATNISSLYLFLIGFLIVLLPFLSYAVYFFTFRLSLKKPFFISFFSLAAAYLLTLFTLFGLNAFSAFFAPSLKPEQLSLSVFFPQPKKLFVQDLLISKNQAPSPFFPNKLKLAQKPPVFLFVVESFRSDAVNARSAPVLESFKKENCFSHSSFANANCTHLAWFSIFFSKLPWHWASALNTGSPVLKYFKELGYRIKVFSSAELSYFNMQEKLFGANLELVDAYLEETTGQSYERDRLIFSKLEQESSLEGVLYLVFLDTPHNEYHHPQQYHKFRPFSKSVNYLKLALWPQTEARILKNRYLNCISYLDTLFADFFRFLKTRNIYDKALIAITGDHGEEFYENGAFFHGSHLCETQLKIPLIYKIPNQKAQIFSCLTSQIDIFPTLLERLTGQKPAFLEGESLFLKNQGQITAFGQNGPLDPVKFILIDQKKNQRCLAENNHLFLLQEEPRLKK
ncbi:MAG: sulfatase-like hydrolase/transferase [Parachlamydiales bacterium]|jgi:hypothetical protein